jgi:hypothetical protein
MNHDDALREIACSSGRMLQKAEARDWDAVSRLASEQWALCSQAARNADTPAERVRYLGEAREQLNKLLVAALGERERIAAAITQARTGTDALRAYARSET